MANGDAAVAAGMDKVLGTADRRLGYDEINKTRDYIAAEKTARTTALAGKQDKLTPAGTAPARQEPGSAHSIGFYTAPSSTLFFRPVVGTGDYDRKVITKQELDAALGSIQPPDLSGYATNGALNSVYEGNMSPSVYNRTLSGQYRVAYVNSGGTLGWVSSSRRHKKNIRSAEVDPAAVLGLRLVTFLYKVEIDPDRLGELQHGLIAEEVDALGLDWLVDYGDDGQPEGIRYDRLALALLPLVQHQDAQLADLGKRLAAVEAHLDALGGDLHA